MTPGNAESTPVRMIEVHCHTRPYIRQVKAGIFGPLAVHPRVAPEVPTVGSYVVTHIATGRALPIYELTRPEAIAIAKLLSAQEIWDFKSGQQFDRPQNDELRKSLDAARRQVLG